jgi:hypothetical protein
MVRAATPPKAGSETMEKNISFEPVCNPEDWPRRSGGNKLTQQIAKTLSRLTYIRYENFLKTLHAMNTAPGT